MNRLIYLLLLTFVSCGVSKDHPVIVTAQPCTVSQTSQGASITCPDGSNGVISNGADGVRGEVGEIGTIGTTGLPGAIGPQGLPGTNGVDATPVTVVQLCHGIPIIYPSSFPEQALCINNTLYAVYWNGSQAFFSALPPGNYASTSPQGCNLTVLPNCVISN